MISKQANIIIEDIENQCLPITGWVDADITTVENYYKTGHDKLDDILSRFHALLNKQFEFMNYCAKRKNAFAFHYNADNSRTLLKIFEQLNNLILNLKAEGIKIIINEKYQHQIDYCRAFIEEYKGSKIPVDYQLFLVDKYQAIFDVVLERIFSGVKMLIFGAEKSKPDIVIKDVLEGNLNIVNDKDVLVYDGDISDSFLYRDFDEWWKIAKEKYKNYHSSLNGMEKMVADFYKRYYRKADNPVLIPQVYIHYDPKDQKFRKKMKSGEILKFQRMDFLIIYSGRRIIIEVDGELHTPGNNLEEYSKQCKYDREMRFLGYEVFRLGGYELTHNFNDTVKTFFKDLYESLEISK